MKIAIEPAGPVSFETAVPGSKSLTNRALVSASLAPGTSYLENASLSDDSRLLIRGLERLGIRVRTAGGGRVLVVRGRGGEIPAASGRFNMGNAGTALRFFASLLCLGRGFYVLDGDARMRQRPIGPLVQALRTLGAEIEYGGREGFPPLRIRARGLRGGRVALSGETSSQFVSSLLLSAPAADGEIEIEILGRPVSRPYIDLTLRIMSLMGVQVRREGYRWFRVPAAAAYRPGRVEIEADAAGANYFLAMAAATGGRARIRGLGRGTLQGEARFFRVLQEMGCQARTGRDWIEIRGGPLRGVEVDMGDMPDSVQTLAAVALFARGRTRVRNVRHLRAKETDRIRALARELEKLGARVQEREDGFTMTPPARIRPAEIETYRDHRMAMSFAVAALGAPGIVIRDPACVTKSFPDFWDRLESLGVRLRRLRR